MRQNVSEEFEGGAVQLFPGERPPEEPAQPGEAGHHRCGVCGQAQGPQGPVHQAEEAGAVGRTGGSTIYLVVDVVLTLSSGGQHGGDGAGHVQLPPEEHPPVSPEVSSHL